MSNKIRQMDGNLAKYYEEHERKDYYDDDQDDSGKFELWCEENGYNQELIEEELNGSSGDCILLEFDTDNDNNNIFPLNAAFNDENKRNEEIFEILKNIYFRGEWKIYKLDANIIDIDMNENQMISTYKLYLQHIKTWGNDGHKNCNMLHFLAISLQNNSNNLLMNIVDSFRREKLEWILHDLSKKNNADWMQNQPISPIKKWMTTHAFIKDLDLRFKNLKKNYSLNSLHKKILEIEDNKEQKTEKSTSKKPIISIQNKHKAKDEGLSLETAITTYAKRNGEHLVLNQTHKIKDKIREIATYIVVSGNFIKQLLSEQYKQPPFSVDFMIIFPPLVGDDMDDYKEDVIGDIISDLKKTGCLYHETEISDTVFDKFKAEMDPIPIARTWIQLGLFKFVHKLKNKNKGEYPQYNRLNIIVDRRNSQNKNIKNNKDRLIFFDPPNECNSIPKGLHPPELYFDQSRQCLIPRPPYKSFEHRSGNIPMNKRTLDATQVANGQLMTFSFHVRTDDDIKCYLLWNGQCIRFYPQDIIDLLPQLFVMNKFGNQKFVDSDKAKQLVSRMEIKDTKFEQFHRALTNKKPNQFPKKYHWNDDKK